MKKLLLLLAGGVGYVLGAKAGRERYDQIMGQTKRIANDPRVQQKAQEARDTVRQQAPVAKEKASQAATSAKSKVKSSDKSETGSSTGTANTTPGTASSTPSTSSPSTTTPSTAAGGTRPTPDATSAADGPTTNSPQA